MKVSFVKRVVCGILPLSGICVTVGLALCARAEELKLIPSDLVPATGNFYSVQRSGYPPLPFNPFPDLPVYALGDNLFLVDDSAVEYAVLASAVAAGPLENGPQGSSGGVFSYGCGLWLDIACTNETTVLLTLHNTRPGQTYQVWRLEDLGQTNWVAETNVTGALGDYTQAVILMGQRTNLFFRASESRVYAVDTNASFAGLAYADAQAPAPDTMGAVGPNHFVEMLNRAIAVFPKTNGSRLQVMSTKDFFNVEVNGTNYPAEPTIDGRILYDHQAGRWVACSLDAHGSRELMLAVSHSSNPMDLVTNWTKHLIRVASTNADSDCATMGLDANGIYLSVAHRSIGTHSGVNQGFTIVAVNKTNIYTGHLVCTNLNVETNEVVSWCIQPAVNFDSPPAGGYAWFVAKGPPDLGGTYRGGAVFYRRLEWVGTNAQWADSSWRDLTNAPTSSRDYYDFDGTNVLRYWSVQGPTALQTNGPGINLMIVGSRLMLATLRNGSLWTCHHVGLAGTNGSYAGGPAGTNADRSAVQWLKLRLNSDATAVDYDAHGRIFDRTAFNPNWYYFPSLAVNCAGDMVAGFSGSSASTPIGAFAAWRLSNGFSPTDPVCLQPGLDVYHRARWGDYSATVVDPTDNWSFWTVQEYADVFSGEPDNWATWITNIGLAP